MARNKENATESRGLRGGSAEERARRGSREQERTWMREQIEGDEGYTARTGVEDAGNKCEDLPPFTGVASVGGWHEARDGRDS